MKKKTHTLVLRVEFDRPRSAKEALADVKDNIWGTFYTTRTLVTDPDSFEVKSFKTMPKTKELA